MHNSIDDEFGDNDDSDDDVKLCEYHGKSEFDLIEKYLNGDLEINYREICYDCLNKCETIKKEYNKYEKVIIPFVY